VSATQRLADLGLELPPVPTPAAAYRPWSRSGGLIFTAGQLPMVDGALLRTGKLGVDLTTADGAELARTVGINLLAVAAEASGDLDRVRVVKLTVFVASAPSFTEQHLVANGVSQLLGEVFDDAGHHARSAVGVPVLPLDSPVEAEAVFELLERGV
jgi:enamine deaminase RidA (YjgF/YER057c/UK114 family)